MASAQAANSSVGVIREAGFRSFGCKLMLLGSVSQLFYHELAPAHHKLIESGREDIDLGQTLPHFAVRGEHNSLLRHFETHRSRSCALRVGPELRKSHPPTPPPFLP